MFARRQFQIKKDIVVLIKGQTVQWMERSDEIQFENVVAQPVDIIDDWWDSGNNKLNVEVDE